LSVTVTNTATLPIGYWLRRHDTLLPISTPGAFQSLYERTAYFTLSGANASPPWTNYSVVVTNLAKPSGVFSTAATLTYADDRDGDGLADAWERAFFGGTQAVPSADPDEDGLTNAEEYVAGTDPTDRSSYLEVDALTTPPGVTLSFNAAANRTYTIEFTDALGTGPWQKLADVPPRPTPRVADVPDPAHAPHRAYRLVTPRQP
jgi:hypothetical protein